MKLNILTCAAMALLIASGTAASAAEVVITQKGKKFDQKKVTISKGDTIKFVNADAMTHNIHSRGAGKFDLGAQKPGTTMAHVFAADGTFKIRCAIHPKMKLKVKVK